MKKLILCLVSLPACAQPDAEKILQFADRSRGGGLPGIVWEIDLVSRSGDKVFDEQKLLVKATGEESVALTLAPARFKGSKLLQIGRNMWLTRPGLSKPIPISPRQRLSGEAANGDIAATDYAGNYEAKYVGEARVDGENCHLIELKAKRATYDRIRYWVSIKREVGVQAQFYSLSGMLLKSARFRYENEIEYRGRRIPFVSEMTISDALTDDSTTMKYLRVQVAKIPAAEFDLGQQ